MAKKTVIVEEIEGDEVDLQGNTQRVVSERVDEPPAPVRAARNHMAGWPVIILEENDNIPPVGQFFGLNGESYILRAGVRTPVPPGIIEILNNAIMSVPRLNPDTLQPVGWKDKLRYPYRLLRAGSAVAA
jgi:hypothetical protein